MPLQEFVHVRAKMRDREPRLGIQRNGRVSINAGGLEALGHPTHVVLLFDSQSLDFGVRAARPEERHSYNLRMDESTKTGANASALALWRYFNIDFEKYLGSYLARQEDGALIISLKGHDDDAAGDH